MQPQTYRQILAQHYVNCPVVLYSEFQSEKYVPSGVFIADVDDTLEFDKTPRLIDLLFERIGFLNDDFKKQLPGVKQDIESMYRTIEIKPSMERLSKRFSDAKVTRRQFEKASKWAVKNYIINPTFKDFVTKDLPSLGFEFMINTGNFDYPLQLLAGKLGLPLNVLNCSTIRYEKEGGEEVVKEIYANVLENKRKVNTNKAAEKSLSQSMSITMADSPQLEPYLPMFAGLAIWVDPNAKEISVESSVNLYIPEARRDIRKITGRLKNWKIALINSIMDSEETERKIIDAVERTKKSFEETKSDNPTVVGSACEKIAIESEILLDRIKRYTPKRANKIKHYMLRLTLKYRIEELRYYANELLEIIKETIPEYYATEELRKQMEELRRADKNGRTNR